MDSHHQQPRALEVLYHQGPCLAVNKPAGLLTQAPPGIDSLEMRVKDYLRQLEDKQGNIYLGVPHRIDRPATGVVVFARHVRAARRIAEQFESRTVAKTYWALVEGGALPPSGTWRDTICKVTGEARAEVVAEGHADGKPAVLRYHVVADGSDFQWLEIQLETGRTHQIRVQAAHRGHPILGDSQYGSPQPFGPATEEPRDRAIALHARTIGLRHPKTHLPIEISAPVPDFWPPEFR